MNEFVDPFALLPEGFEIEGGRPPPADWTPEPEIDPIKALPEGFVIDDEPGQAIATQPKQQPAPTAQRAEKDIKARAEIDGKTYVRHTTGTIYEQLPDGGFKAVWNPEISKALGGKGGTARGKRIADAFEQKTTESSTADIVKAGIMPGEIAGGIAQGAISTIGTMAKGAAGAGLSDPGIIVPLIDEMKQNAKTWDNRQASHFITTAAKALPNSPRLVALLPHAIRAIKNGEAETLADVPMFADELMAAMQDPRQTEAYKLGQSLQDYAEKTFAGDPRLKDTFYRTAILQGLGSTLPFLATGLMPGGLALTSGTAVAAGQGEALENAIQTMEQGKPVTRKQMLDAMSLGAVPGATDVIPIEIMLNRVPIPYLRTAIPFFGKVLRQAFVEGGQEGAQQVMQNLITRFNYDPAKEPFEQFWQNFAAGFGVGGIMQAGTSAVEKTLGIEEQPPSPSPPDQPPPPMQQVNVVGKADQERLAELAAVNQFPEPGTVPWAPRQAVETLPEGFEIETQEAAAEPTEPAAPAEPAEQPLITSNVRHPELSKEQVVDLESTNPDLLARFKEVQNEFGASVPIVSAFRGKKRNEAVGGAKKSQHVAGNAIDLDVSKLSKAERVRLIEIASAKGITGIGVYANSLHFDLGKRRVWGPDRHAGSVPEWAASAVQKHLGGEDISRVPTEAEAEAPIAPQTAEGEVAREAPAIVSEAADQQVETQSIDAAQAALPEGFEIETAPKPAERPTEPLPSDAYAQAQKQANGKFKLFYRGTRNEIFPGETFATANDARNYLKVMRVKAAQATEKPSTARKPVAAPTAPTEVPSPAQPVPALTDRHRKAFSQYLKTRRPLDIDKIAKSLKISAADTGRLLSEAAKDGRVLYTKTGTWRRLGKIKHAMGIVEALTRAGGIKDTSRGDLKAMDLHKKFGPGGRLVTKGGMSLDEAVTWAVENQYLADYSGAGRPVDVGTNELMELLREDEAGRKQYATGDAEQARADEEARAQEDALSRYEPAERAIIEKHGYEFYTGLQTFFADSGTSLSDWQTEDIDRAAVLAKEDETVDNALERAAFEAIDASAGEEAGIDETDRAEIPGYGEKAGQGGQAGAEPQAREGIAPRTEPGEDIGKGVKEPRREEGVESAAPEAEAKPAVEAIAGPGEAEKISVEGKTATAPTTEPGAEGAQHIIPGTEPITPAEQARRKAAQPLKPTVAQKPADVGLFGDESTQTDLIDQIRKAEKPTALPSRPRALPMAAQSNIPIGNRYRLGITDQQQADLEQEIASIARRVLGRHAWGMKLQLPATIEGDTQGLWNPSTKTMYVALRSATDPRLIANHEFIHVLREAGVFTPREWTTLARVAKARWLKQYQIEERYAEVYGNLDSAERSDLMLEEAVAEAFLDFIAAGGTKGESAAERIFATVLRFLEAVRNMLAGRGFTNVESVFEAIETGEMGERAPGQGPGRLAQLAQQPRPSSIVERDIPGFDGLPALPRQHIRNLRALGSITGKIDYLWFHGRRKVTDQFVAIKRIQDQLGNISPDMDTYLAESLFHGKVPARLDNLENDWLKPLVNMVKNHNLSLEDVDEYLQARHAPERNTYIASINPKFPDGGSGITDAEAAQTIRDFARRGKIPGLEAVAAMVDDLIEQARTELLRSGLISQDTYNEWKSRYKYYVPLRGFEVDPTQPENFERSRVGRKFDIRGPEAKAALGRKSIADSPLAYAILQAQQAIVRGEKNRVGKRFLRTIQENPMPDLWEISPVTVKRFRNASGEVVERVVPDTESENIWHVKIGGEVQSIRINDEYILKAMKGIGIDHVGSFVRIMHSTARYFAYMATSANPEFVVSNFFRDLGTAAFNLAAADIPNIRRDVLSDLPRAIAGVHRGMGGHRDTTWARYYHEFKDSGGKIGFANLMDIESNRDKLRVELADLDPSNPRKALIVLRTLKEEMERVNSAVENGLRLSTYITARRAGWSKERAASLSRELTVNFNRRGEWGVAMNALYLFANAGTQGAANVMRHLARSPKVRALALAAIAVGFLTDMLNRWISDDKDDDERNDYDQLPFYIKERNFVMALPGGKGFFTPPLPWGYNVFHVMGQQIAQTIFDKQHTPAKATINIGRAVLNAFNPIGGSDNVAKILSPTLLDPFIEIYANKDWIGRDIMPQGYPNAPTPDSQKFWSSVGPVEKKVAQKINELTGGNEVRPGGIDISPEIIEYWENFIFGGAGAFLARSRRFVEKVLAGESLESYEVPFVRRVYTQTSKVGSSQEYRDIVDAANMSGNEFELYRDKRDTAKTREIRQTPDYKMLGIVKGTESQLRKLRKARREIEASKATEEAKAARIEKINEFMQKLQTNVRRKYHMLLDQMPSP